MSFTKTTVKIVNVLLFTSLGVYLQGCTATSNDLATGEQEVRSQYDDGALSHKVMVAINKNTTLRQNARINPLVYKGEVMLIGEVSSKELKQEAEKLARGVAGVKVLYNKLVVGENIGGFESIKDSAITSQIKSQYVVTAGIDSARISVTTENGVVYLMGGVEKDQIPTVVNIARHTSGVRMVVNAIKPLVYASNSSSSQTTTQSQTTSPTQSAPVVQSQTNTESTQTSEN